MITDIPFELVNIEDDGFHIVVKGVINDKAARLIVDTGASRSVFDLDRLISIFDEEMELESVETKTTGIGEGKIKLELATIRSLRLGKLLLEDYKAAVINMSHINETYASIGLGTIDGMIGNDILQKYGAVIDFNAGLVELKF